MQNLYTCGMMQNLYTLLPHSVTDAASQKVERSYTLAHISVCKFHSDDHSSRVAHMTMMLAERSAMMMAISFLVLLLASQSLLPATLDIPRDMPGS